MMMKYEENLDHPHLKIVKRIEQICMKILLWGKVVMKLKSKAMLPKRRNIDQNL